MLYADIIVDISHEKVDRAFQYRIPSSFVDQVSVGCQVLVPFGRGNKEIIGYCIGISKETDYDPSKVKEIIAIRATSNSADGYMIRLADFLKRRYGATMIQALKTVLPMKQEVRALEKKTIKVLLEEEALQEYYDSIAGKKNQLAKIKSVEYLLGHPRATFEELTKNLNIALSTIRSLEKDGVLLLQSETFYRNPVKLSDVEQEEIVLSDEQQHIVDNFISDRKKGEKCSYYIKGITGSGKTAVYIALIEEVLKAGQQAIVLIPEISLTYQTLKRFYARFGQQVSVMNSTLSMGEKYDQLQRAKQGELRVVIGPRSALFVPFDDIGLIIIDEEHETSYKSEQTPKYHALEVAEEIASIHGAAIVLGSATPSVEAYQAVQDGKYRLFSLTKRLTGGTLPTTHIIDLREELKAGNRTIFSNLLQEKIQQRLEKKEQIMLFLNRRGYSGFISCRSCGHVMECKHCSVSLSEHRDGYLYCHYCGYKEQKAVTCPTCGSKYIAGFKVGTQQIEEKVRQMFPKARTLRMDADTTRTKDSYEKILASFERQEADILIGTQMIVKGHDFKNVTLVGVIAADLSLSIGDYRAAERTYQLITQAVGRAGRGEKLGEAVIQTYRPDHYSITCAAGQEYEQFFEQEIAYRKLMQYPPMGHMLAVQLYGKEEKRLESVACDLADYIKVNIVNRRLVQILGPTKAGIYKINDVYRYVIYIKADTQERLLYIKELLEIRKKQREYNNEIMQFDFDPKNAF